MDLALLLRICNAYNDLGWAVQEQIPKAANERMSECNPNALRMIRDDYLAEIIAAGEGTLAGEEAKLLGNSITEHLSELDKD